MILCFKLVRLRTLSEDAMKEVVFLSTSVDQQATVVSDQLYPEAHVRGQNPPSAVCRTLDTVTVEPP